MCLTTRSAYCASTLRAWLLRVIGGV